MLPCSQLAVDTAVLQTAHLRTPAIYDQVVFISPLPLPVTQKKDVFWQEPSAQRLFRDRPLHRDGPLHLHGPHGPEKGASWPCGLVSRVLECSLDQSCKRNHPPPQQCSVLQAAWCGLDHTFSFSERSSVTQGFGFALVLTPAPGLSIIWTYLPEHMAGPCFFILQVHSPPGL